MPSGDIHSISSLATFLFAIAVVHTFFTSVFRKLANRYPEGSIAENVFHLLGEVEIVFGIWASIFICLAIATIGLENTVNFLERLRFTEPVFVFVILCIASTRPILIFAKFALLRMSSFVFCFFPKWSREYLALMIFGPLLGSFITEPAAMTVTAILLQDRFYYKISSAKFMYLSLGVLFVNVSTGGLLTHFAAPPVLMVAHAWNWDTAYVFMTFGWRSMLSVVCSASVAAILLRTDLLRLTESTEEQDRSLDLNFSVIAVHLFFLALVVFFSHHIVLFVPVFLLFLGWFTASKEHQAEIRIRESLLVAYFLGGLVVLGELQQWWLKPIIEGATENELFFGATALTAVFDNAALTYLSTLVPAISEASKYAVVAGAVCGGGLTVIANAPNPAGFAILQGSFGEEGINPFKLFLAAVPFTVIAVLSFLI